MLDFLIVKFEIGRFKFESVKSTSSAIQKELGKQQFTEIMRLLCGRDIITTCADVFVLTPIDRRNGDCYRVIRSVKTGVV